MRRDFWSDEVSGIRPNRRQPEIEIFQQILNGQKVALDLYLELNDIYVMERSPKLGRGC